MAEHRPTDGPVPAGPLPGDHGPDDHLPDDHLPDDAVVTALALDVAIDLAGHPWAFPDRGGRPVDGADDDLLEMATVVRAIGAADRALAGPTTRPPITPAAVSPPLDPSSTAPVLSLRPVVLPPMAAPPRRVRRRDRRRQVVAVAVAASAVALAIGADLALQAGGGAGPADAGWALPATVRMTLASDRVVLAPPGGGPSSADRITAVSCMTDQHCLAVADADGHAVIAVSNDGGTTWQRQSAPVAAELSAILCATPAHCWAVGSAGTGSRGNEAVILTTSDGGRTWSTGSVPAGVGSLQSISCATVETCWAVGSAGGGTGAAIVATSDGGRTWSTEPVPVGVGSLASVSCPVAETCWAGGQAAGDATVVATTDGGRTWERQALPTDDTAVDDTAVDDAATVSSITCTPALTCWAAATDGAGTVTVLAGGPDGWHVSARAGGGGISGFVASPGCATGCRAPEQGGAANTALATIEGGTAAALRGRTTTGAVTCPTARECWLVRTSGTGFTSTALALDR